MCVRSLAQCVPCVFWIIYIICTLYAAWRRQPGVIAPPTPRTPLQSLQFFPRLPQHLQVTLRSSANASLPALLLHLLHFAFNYKNLDSWHVYTMNMTVSAGGGGKGCRVWCELVFFLFPCPNTIRESVEKTCTHPVRRVTPIRRKKQFICKSSESLSHPPPATPPPGSDNPCQRKKIEEKEKPKFVCSKRSNLQLPLRAAPSSSSSSAAVASVVQRCYDS